MEDKRRKKEPIYYSKGKSAAEFQEAVGLREGVLEDEVKYLDYKRSVREACKPYESIRDINSTLQSQIYDQLSQKTGLDTYYIHWLVHQHYRGRRKKKKAQFAEESASPASPSRPGSPSMSDILNHGPLRQSEELATEKLETASLASDTTLAPSEQPSEAGVPPYEPSNKETGNAKSQDGESGQSVAQNSRPPSYWQVILTNDGTGATPNK